MEGKARQYWGMVCIARKGWHLWGGVWGHSRPNPAHHLPFFLGTTYFRKVSGLHATGLASPWATTTALWRGLVSLWPINIEAERVSMKHSSPNQRSFILHLFLYVVSESLILRRGCGYTLFSFSFLFFLSFWALYFWINFMETCANAFQCHVSCHFLIRAGQGGARVYLRDAILSLIHCNKCHCKAAEGELAFINILQFCSPSGGR